MPSLSEPRCGQPSKSPPRKNKQAFDNAHAATMTSAGPRPPPSLNPNPSNTLQPHPAKSPPPELRSHGSATFPIPATPSKQPTSASPTPKTPVPRPGNFPNPPNPPQKTNLPPPPPNGPPFPPPPPR